MKLFFCLFMFAMTSISLNVLAAEDPAQRDPSKIVYYSNEYKGLEPGFSTLAEVKAVLGEPKEVEETINGNNYQFEGVTVNFSGTNQEVINTIAITDSGYICPNGIKVGDDVVSAQKKLQRYSNNGTNNLFDGLRGISYWYEEGKITVITLAYQSLA